MIGSDHLVRSGARRFVSDFLQLKPGERVVITSDTATDPETRAQIFDAVYEAGVRPTLMTIPVLPFQGALADPFVPPSVLPAVLAADLWIDLTFPYLAGSHVHDEVIKAGVARYALAGDVGPGSIARLFGSTDLDRYFAVHVGLDEVLAAAKGKRARITCPNGTDVSFVLDKAPYRKPRAVVRPGSYTLPGSCAFFPELESVRGRIVFTAIFHEFYTPCSDLSIDVDGVIRRVEGPVEHRAVLDRALRRAGNGNYGNVIHFTHGLNPCARTTGRSFIEDSRVVGCNAIGMGLPWWQPGGGENHPDGLVSDQSVWLNEEQIIDNGLIVHPPELAALARELLPAAPLSC